MTVYVLEIAPLAERDIQDAFIWYRERNAAIADAFRAEAFEVIQKIGASPRGKAADEEGNSRRVLHRFPYSVVYELVENTVTIVAVSHHRRSPNYWRPARP